MNTRIKHALSIGAAAVLAGGGLALTSASPAAAAGQNCYTDVAYEAPPFPDVPAHWVAWAYCPEGTGWFIVTVTCVNGGDGSTYYDARADAKQVGGGQRSRQDCAGGNYPQSIGYSTWD